jgi:hypothetical protein
MKADELYTILRKAYLANEAEWPVFVACLFIHARAGGTILFHLNCPAWHGLRWPRRAHQRSSESACAGYASKAALMAW